MIQTEYTRSANCNYERILLEEKPDEKKYQYCILSRGGIKGLLPCSLRYINGRAYLYYDISSRQNVLQLYGSRIITREWMKDFVWSVRQVMQETGRFLLDMGNILWYPEQIFQDLESNIFSFLYIPYYEGEPSFIKLIEFWVEHIDYDDEILVDCVYHMYDQVERGGESYLQLRFFEDAKRLEEERECKQEQKKEPADCAPETLKGASVCLGGESFGEMSAVNKVEKKAEKKGILSIFEGKRGRNKKIREDYRQSMQLTMTEFAVAEETNYGEEEYGRTVFMEEKGEGARPFHKLCTPQGRLLAKVEGDSLSIGKKKEEVDLALEDSSVSRLHARITLQDGEVCLEDLNSTNGTFKNGLRLQPYEKRRLEEGDEIKFGKVLLIFR